MFQKINPQYRYYLFSFLTGLFFAGPFLHKFFTHQAGIDQLQINFLQSIFMASMAVFMVPTGMFADTFGRKKSIIIGLIIGSISNVVYGLFPIFWVMILAEILSGTEKSFVGGADKALLEANLDENQAKNSSSFLAKAFVWHMIGLFIASLIGNVLVNFGLQWPLIASSIPLLFAIWVINSFEESKNGTSDEEESFLKQAQYGITYLIKHPKLANKSWTAILISCSAYFVFWLFPVLVQKLSGENIWLTATFNLIIGIELILAFAFSRMSGAGKENLLTMSKYAVVLGFLLVSLRITPITVGLFAALSGGFGLSYWSLYMANIQKDIPKAKQATVNSGIDTIRQIVLIIANPIIGWLALHDPGVIEIHIFRYANHITLTNPQIALLALTGISAIALIIKHPRS